MLKYIYLLGFLYLISCVDDRDYQLTNTEIKALDLRGKTEITFKQLLNLHNRKIGKDTIVKGYVVSSDEKGNFFKEIYIQNTLGVTDIKKDNPRMGIKIRIGLKNSHTKYALGRKIVLNLHGLQKTTSNNLITVGQPNLFFIKDILEFDIDTYILKTNEIATITAKETTISNLSKNDLNTFIKLKEVHFKKHEIGLPLANLPTDDFDGERVLEFCNQTYKDSIVLETSNFSDFSSEIISNKQITISGIYQINFDKKPVLVLNEFADLQQTGVYVDCPKISTPNLMITEVADPKVGSGEKARYVEIYNPTGTVVLLDNWNLIRYNKTKTNEYSYTISLTGLSIAPRKVIVIAYNSMDKINKKTSFENYFGFSSKLTHQYLDGNGDDAYELIDPLGNIKDAYGVSNVDGTDLAWEYENGVAIRKLEIQDPNSVFKPSEWIIKKELPLLKKELNSIDFTPGTR